MEKSVFLPADILLPVGIDMAKWSVVACDQFSSEPDYWKRVSRTVDGSPSTLRMIVPEAYLGNVTAQKSASEIADVMADYLDGGVFRELLNSFIYVERTVTGCLTRRGLIGMIDLESYDFADGSCSAVRASERTIAERLPARIEVRRMSPLELPHIMALIDDADMLVIEPLAEKKDDLEKVYDFELMEGGGRIKGWRVCGQTADAVSASLRSVLSGKKINIVIGDGNHSLAASKVYWDEIKQTLGAEAMLHHPARYALAELNNVYDPAVCFEAIHRVVFDTEPERLINEFQKSLPGEGRKNYEVRWVSGERRGRIDIPASSTGGLIGTIQSFLDAYSKRTGCMIDYIHGEENAEALSQAERRVGLILPAMEKSDLFATVAQGVVFPKKSFSIGQGRDKRYYLECRRIKP